MPALYAVYGRAQVNRARFKLQDFTFVQDKAALDQGLAPGAHALIIHSSGTLHGTSMERRESFFSARADAATQLRAICCWHPRCSTFSATGDTMKKIAKGKLRLDTTSLRNLNNPELQAAAGGKPPTSWGDPTCHTGSGMSNCHNCWSWDGDHSCYC